LGKGKPFLEVLSSAIHEDYRFPFLEFFAFLYALSTFVFANMNIVALKVTTSEGVAYTVTSTLIGMSLIVFIVLILKNVAYGLGSDLEKGIIQTYFSYPLKRWKILTAKLVSAVGVSLLLFLGIQIAGLYILAPDIIVPQLGTVILTYIAYMSYPLTITGIMLLLTLIFRKGGIGLVVGIVLYFSLTIVSGIVSLISGMSGSPLALQILSVISPTYALQFYFGAVYGYSTLNWVPTLNEVLLYTGASYVIVALLFILGHVYFSRRFNL
jgi:ABC-type transport system involved in multi-copper enzyme maturation permease subunit